MSDSFWLFLIAGAFLSRIIACVLYVVVVLSLVSLLTGCGDGSQLTPQDSSNLQSIALTQDEINPYKQICVDDNLALVEAHYQSCLPLYSQESCDSEKAIDTVSIMRAWHAIEAELPGKVIDCNADFRVSDDYCKGFLIEWLSREARLCQFY